MYTLHFGNHTIGFDTDSYHFIEHELWLLVIDAKSSELSMTCVTVVPISDTWHPDQSSTTIENNYILTHATSTADEVIRAQAALVDIKAKFVDYPYSDSIKTYSGMSKCTAYTLDGRVVMWSDNGGDTLMFGPSSSYTRIDVKYSPANSVRMLLGDMYYFILDQKAEGLRRWELAANGPVGMIADLAALRVMQYGRHSTTRSKEDIIAAYLALINTPHLERSIYASAYFHLGKLYDDSAESIICYLKGAQFGNVFAANAMGERSNNSVEKMNWYTLAANGKYPRAEYHLGREYLTQNKSAEAMLWLYRASLHGNDDAEHLVEKLLGNSTRNVVVVLQTRHDHNGAFAYKGIRELERHFPNFVAHFNFVHVYIENLDQIASRLRVICGVNGHRKIAHLIIMAHGHSESLRILADTSIDSTKADILSKIVRPHLAPSSSIFLCACSTGHGGPYTNNFAQSLADHLPGHVIHAADGPFIFPILQITECAPDTSETYLAITYLLTPGPTNAKICNFECGKAFRAVLQSSPIGFSNNTTLEISIISTGTVQFHVGTEIVIIPIPLTRSYPPEVTDPDSRGKYISLKIGVDIAYIEIPWGTYVFRLMITGNVRIISNTLFRQCLTSVNDYGYIQLPEKCFEGCINLERVPDIAYSHVLPSNLESFFSGCTSLVSRLDNWDTAHVTNMNSMFRGCQALTSVGADWNTGRVTNMASMFSECTRFNGILNQWDVSHVQNMSYMFTGCRAFDQPLDRWNVSHIRYMTAMFYGCTVFRQRLNTWNVSAVQNMVHMFTECISCGTLRSRWLLVQVQMPVALDDRVNSRFTDWLLSVDTRLAGYAQKLVDNGVDTPAILRIMTESMLIDIGIDSPEARRIIIDAAQKGTDIW